MASIQTVFVKEGDTVSQGAKLAEIGCPDLQTALAEAVSQVESARQVRVRLLRGSRDEERRMAAEQTAAATSELKRATANLERMKMLLTKAIVSNATFDDAERDYKVATAKLEEATRHEQLTNAPPLPEEVAKADADIAAADNRMLTIQEKIGKCTVTAPISGTILRVLLRPGESFSTLAPRPLFTISDISVRRVRAEIDERDVLKVHTGQNGRGFRRWRRGPEVHWQSAADRQFHGPETDRLRRSRRKDRSRRAGVRDRPQCGGPHFAGRHACGRAVLEVMAYYGLRLGEMAHSEPRQLGCGRPAGDVFQRMAARRNS